MTTSFIYKWGFLVTSIYVYDVLLSYREKNTFKIVVFLDTTAGILTLNIFFPKREEESWIRSAVPQGALKIQAFGIYGFICNWNKKETVEYPVQLWKLYLKIYDNV